MVKTKIISPFSMGGRSYLPNQICEFTDEQAVRLASQGLIATLDNRKKDIEGAPEDKMVKGDYKKKRRKKKK